MVICRTLRTSGGPTIAKRPVICFTLKELSMVLRFATVVLLGLSLLVSAPRAQAPAGQTDPEFAELVKKWTTKPEFLSPLVDHLPKKAGVPSPKDILGYHIGEPKKLTYTADQFRFFRALE
jgi:hypothetical protein